MGGKPNPGTKPDKRLAENKKPSPTGKGSAKAPAAKGNPFAKKG